MRLGRKNILTTLFAIAAALTMPTVSATVILLDQDFESPNSFSGTFDVEISLTKLPPRLAAGLIASVEIFPKSEGEQTVVPLDALIEAESNSAKIFTVKNGKAQSHDVQMAFLHGDRAVISEGLNGVEKVVTDGAAYLVDGVKVEVVE